MAHARAGLRRCPALLSSRRYRTALLAALPGANFCTGAGLASVIREVQAAAGEASIAAAGAVTVRAWAIRVVVAMHAFGIWHLLCV